MRLFSDRTPDHPRSSGAGCAGRGDLRGGVADGPIHRYSVAASALPAILGHGQAPLLGSSPATLGVPRVNGRSPHGVGHAVPLWGQRRLGTPYSGHIKLDRH